jgi:hypothetical protein
MGAMSKPSSVDDVARRVGELIKGEKIWALESLPRGSSIICLDVGRAVMP